MKYIISAILIACSVLLPGCGKQGSMKDAKEQLAAMLTEFDKKAREEVTFDGPVKVDMLAKAMKDTRDPQALAQAQGLDYVQYSSSRRQYEFIGKNFDTEPLEAIIRETDLYILYKEVERTKVLEYEQRTGGVYDPTLQPVAQPIKLKIVDVTYTFDRKFTEWKEASRETVFDVNAGQDGGEEEESEE